MLSFSQPFVVFGLPRESFDVILNGAKLKVTHLSKVTEPNLRFPAVFCENLRFSAKICGFLRKYAVFCGCLRPPNA